MTPPPGVPPAEVEIDADLVRRLLAAQHPDLAGLSIAPFAEGWDNVMFRLGDDLVVRLPRREVAAALIVSEQTWLGRLAPRLPLPIPAPVRLGAPGEAYPWRWSVLPWLVGTPADLAEPGDDQGEVWAGFLRALHIPAPADAPRNPVRGVPLVDRLTPWTERVQRLNTKTDLIDGRVLSLWARALEAPIDAGPVWLHGDPHARNVLVEAGKFSAVIDWGDMAGGDPANDLASIWMLLPKAEMRARAMAAYGAASEATWMRARGWAALFGVMLLDAGLINDTRLAVMGARTLRRLVEGP